MYESTGVVAAADTVVAAGLMERAIRPATIVIAKATIGILYFDLEDFSFIDRVSFFGYLMSST
jgi:hypothetical protein